MVYLDAGCLVKLYYPEHESAAVAAAVVGDQITFTALHELELVTAMELTIANRLSKDPAVAGLVSLAERIHEQWQAGDKATALEQRAAAEEALKKLAEVAA